MKWYDIISLLGIFLVFVLKFYWDSFRKNYRKGFLSRQECWFVAEHEPMVWVRNKNSTINSWIDLSVNGMKCRLAILTDDYLYQKYLKNSPINIVPYPGKIEVCVSGSQIIAMRLDGEKVLFPSGNASFDEELSKVDDQVARGLKIEEYLSASIFIICIPTLIAIFMLFIQVFKHK